MSEMFFVLEACVSGKAAGGRGVHDKVDIVECIGNRIQNVVEDSLIAPRLAQGTALTWQRWTSSWTRDSALADMLLVVLWERGTDVRIVKYPSLYPSLGSSYALTGQWRGFLFLPSVAYS